MFASAQKQADEQGKLVASLAKQVETLTAKAKSKAPRGITRARSGRRLDFETPGDRAARADRLPQAKTLTNLSNRVRNRLRRIFHLPLGTAKKTTSNESTWTLATDPIIRTIALTFILEGPEVSLPDRRCPSKNP